MKVLYIVLVIIFSPVALSAGLTDFSPIIEGNTFQSESVAPGFSKLPSESDALLLGDGPSLRVGPGDTEPLPVPGPVSEGTVLLFSLAGVYALFVGLNYRRRMKV